LAGLAGKQAESCNNYSLEKKYLLLQYSNNMQQLTFDDSRGASEGQLALNFTAWSQVRLEAKVGRLAKFRNKTKAI